ncbi:hypothetical protein T440DRAFT_538782 [Plenodomus tracheiphilus IPT5]|uniref:F-box domain-containing protein n=1 Tax=Plenodomus tracheiphilus IPT5 TaxID=1408161 RepID=A0A6A7AZ33_9PLEO|nr:hypothetical protein T440DRAFT_538782 [Plenodomus tracheiphilus IPT5]
MPSLLALPNEILLQIISNIDVHREDRILGHDPESALAYQKDHFLLTEFRQSCRTLKDLSLTCKRLSPMVAEQMAFAPVVANWKWAGSFERPPEPDCTHLLALVRTFVNQPERMYWVKQLRISLCPDVYYEQDTCASKQLAIEVRTLIDSLELPSTLKPVLSEDAQQSPSKTLVSVLLMLLPRLERLCISRAAVVHVSTGPERPCCLLNGLPFPSLEYLKIEHYKLLDLVHLQSCAGSNTLDLSIPQKEFEHTFALPGAGPTAGPASPAARHPSPLRHLRLDFQTSTVGIWNHGKRMHMVDLLQKFRNLKSLDFYAEPSDCKNPFRSVRAFPHYQANIQNYPHQSGHLPPHVDDQYWDQRVYDARTEVTDYQNLVDSIVHLRPSLEALRLPGGFWTLPGGVRKPIPRFSQFQRLGKLVIPQAAIVSIRLDNMRLDDVAGDFDLSPKMALPPMLQHLEVFDVDAPFLCSRWLLDFFGAQISRRQWPAFQQLELRIGYTVQDEELDAIVARSSTPSKAFIMLAQTAPFRIIVRRDDDVPSTGPLSNL